MGDKPARVLVVEDESRVRSLLCRILSGAGHDVLEGETEWEALELTLAGAIDAVIIDVGLGSMDGIKTMAAIRRLQPEVPLIVVSGGDREEILNRMEAGGLRSRVWWVGKPFMPERLLDVIDHALAD